MNIKIIKQYGITTRCNLSKNTYSSNCNAAKQWSKALYPGGIESGGQGHLYFEERLLLGGWPTPLPPSRILDQWKKMQTEAIKQLNFISNCFGFSWIFTFFG